MFDNMRHADEDDNGLMCDYAPLINTLLKKTPHTTLLPRHTNALFAILLLTSPVIAFHHLICKT